jgi:alkylated DNA repair dioxygenase AlkB
MRCAKLVDLPINKLTQIIITRYPPGAGIRYHREPPAYGPGVGVSLLSACMLRFQRIMPNKERQVYQVALAPRSAYVLSDEARTLWQHGIPPVADLRYSITFRMEKAKMRWLPE